MAKKKVPSPEKDKLTRLIKRELPCELTVQEFSNRAHALSVNLAECELIDVERKATAKKFANRLTSLEVEQDRLRVAVETRSEPRIIECEETKDWNANQIIVRRKDTGAIIEERAMTREERESMQQPELPERPENDIADPEDGAEARQ